MIERASNAKPPKSDGKKKAGGAGVTSTKSTLQEAFEYYLAHQDELVEKYANKFIVIKNGDVLGAYDDELTAITETGRAHELGTFLVQRVTPGDSAYTQTFHSRVVIL